MCPSGSADVERLWQTYQDDGLVVWGIAMPGEGTETEAAVRDYVETFGITHPVLLDDGGTVSALFPAPWTSGASAAPFPQEWLIDADGVIAWYTNTVEWDELVAAVEAELPP